MFGILFDKTEQAIAQFNKIKNQYVELSAKAIKQVNKPTVLVNIPYGSTWFVPAGDNFMAHLIRDAGGDYVFANTKGSFNLKLSLEAVIESGLEADFWINPGRHTHKTSLLKEDLASHYLRRIELIEFLIIQKLFWSNEIMIIFSRFI